MGTNKLQGIASKTSEKRKMKATRELDADEVKGLTAKGAAYDKCNAAKAIQGC